MGNNGYSRGRSTRSGRVAERVSGEHHSGSSGSGHRPPGNGARVFVTMLGAAVLFVIVFTGWLFRGELGGLLRGATATPMQTQDMLIPQTPTPEASATPTPTPTPVPTPEPTPTPTPQPTAQDITISAVGDLMAHQPQLDSAYDKASETYDFTENYKEITDELSAADLTIGNLETTLSGEEKKYSGYPAFNTPDSVLDALKAAGFDLLTTSNNHSMDRGWAGAKRTLETLDAAGIPHTGTFASKEDADKPLIVDVQGIKVAVLAYTYGSNRAIEKSFSIKTIDLSVVKADIGKARQQGAQIVIICPHWGAEKARVPSDKVQSQAKAMLEYGADAVIGSHPHVLQKIERMEVTREDGSSYNGLVAYSLGNFISNQQFQYQDTGMILTVTFSRDPLTDAITVKNVTYEPTWVYLDDNKKYTVLPIGKTLDDQALFDSLTAKAQKRIRAAWQESIDLLGEEAATPVR